MEEVLNALSSPEGIATVVGTFVAALVGTGLGGLVTYRASSKSEENKRIHESRIADAKLCSHLSDLVVEWSSKAKSHGRAKREEFWLEAPAIQGGYSTEELKEVEDEHYVEAAHNIEDSLTSKLETASYDMRHEKSQEKLSLMLKRVEEKLKISKNKEKSISEQSEAIDEMFKELLADLLKEHEASQKRLKEWTRKGFLNHLRYKSLFQK